MRIELHEIPIRDVAEGYTDSQDNGVTAYSCRLNIRPAFQREFIYSPEQRKDVIRSIIKEYPLNVMYWIRKDDGTFEMLDGQQRTLSICKFIHEGETLDDFTFNSLPVDKRQKILDYPLMIYICEGTSGEIMDWFRVINIAGEKLTEQETRNAAHTGPWLTDAKTRFSKRDCEAVRIAGDYMKGSPIRQELIETAIRWIAKHDNVTGDKDPITAYMSIHQHDQNCNDMWLYFQSIINWVKVLFPEPESAMKSIDWGKYYDTYHTKSYDAAELKQRIKDLSEDDEVTSQKGIYEYLIDGDERHLSLRKFSDKIKRAKYESQAHRCAHCGGVFEIEEMEADHIKPWSEGGRTIESNCQVLCKRCNRTKSSK